MIKNRTAQLIFYTIYCTLGLVGCIASLGIFDNVSVIRWDFYVHFTNISNFFSHGTRTNRLCTEWEEQRGSKDFQFSSLPEDRVPPRLQA